MATTPPPGLLREPHAPRHGAGYDSYEPYPARHSERIARQKLAARNATPPPPSPKKDGRQSNLGTLSPPRTRSPRKVVRGQALLADDLDQSGSSQPATASPSKRSRVTLLPPDSTLLPTPVKTPSSNKKSYADLGNVARSLFPTTSSTRAKKTKNPTGFSLGSFDEGSDGSHNTIEIFTDTRDRIPTANNHPDNIFAKKADVTMPSSVEPVMPKRRKLTPSATPDLDPKDTVKRDDGMLYTFRGKKLFRKFDEKDEEKEESDDDGDLGLFANRPDLLDSSVNLHVPRVTRSGIRGRVLFPSNEKVQNEEVSPPTKDDEEATTDIDEHVEPVDSDDAVASSEEAAEDVPPKRSLRSHLPDGEKTAPHLAAIVETHKKGKRGSPFDIWKRKKQSPIEASIPKKREADNSPVTTAPATKKTRGN